MSNSFSIRYSVESQHRIAINSGGLSSCLEKNEISFYLLEPRWMESRSREGVYIFSFYFPLQNSFRSTVDRGIHGQVPLGGRVFQRSELRHSIETNFVSQLIATCLGSDENNA